MSYPKVDGETVKRAGLTLDYFYEEDAEFANPRQFDNLGTMVCWHPDYILGDFQLAGSRGAVDNIFETERGRTEFRSMRHVERYLRLAKGAIVTIPLYLYDHSGISMSAGAPNPFDNPRVRSADYGNGLGWDTSMVGFIYTTAERVRVLCGAPDYKPKDYVGTFEAWIAEQLIAEVHEYDLYLTGQVYGYTIKDANGDVLDSCGGFLGFETAKEEAEAAFALYVKDAEQDAAEEETETIGAEAFAPERRYA